MLLRALGLLILSIVVVDANALAFCIPACAGMTETEVDFQSTNSEPSAWSRGLFSFFEITFATPWRKCLLPEISR